MEIAIKGEPEEIAALVLELQERQKKVDLSVKNYIPIPKTLTTVIKKTSLD